MLFRNKREPETVVEVIAFNYDGKGSVLYRYRDEPTIYELSLPELQDRLLGKLNGEEAAYEIFDAE